MKYRHKFTFSTFISFYEKISFALDHWPANRTPQESLIYLSLDRLCRRLYKFTYKDSGTVTITFDEIEMLTLITSLPRLNSVLTGHYETIQINNFIQEIDKRLLIC